MRLSNLNSVEMERCSAKRVRAQSGPIRMNQVVGFTALRWIGFVCLASELF